MLETIFKWFVEHVTFVDGKISIDIAKSLKAN